MFTKTTDIPDAAHAASILRGGGNEGRSLGQRYRLLGEIWHYIMEPYGKVRSEQFWRCSFNDDP